MAVTVDNGSLTDYAAKTSTVGGEEVQHIRLDIGSGGTESQVSAANPLPSEPPKYAARVDEGATYTYIGEAEVGASVASAVWRIKRMTNSDYTLLWADGDAAFDNIWNNRASLSYS